MPGSEDSWRAGRIAAFVAIGLALYAGLYLWSDAVLRDHSQRNPFYRIAEATESTDWIVLGASHAIPFGLGDMPHGLEEATGRRVLTLGVPGGGPFMMRLVGERYFADHQAVGVLIVLDDFAFADARWNAERLGDSDIMPKIPADLATLRVFADAVPRGLRWQSLADYAAGFSRINDRTRFQSDRWEAEDKFETEPRPSDVADMNRIAYLYPGPPQSDALDRGFADLDALIGLAKEQGARVVLVRPPLPDRFRTLLPSIEGFETRMQGLSAQHDVPLFDFSQTIPEPRYYFDTDHLNRAGMLRWLDEGLGAILRGADSGA